MGSWGRLGVYLGRLRVCFGDVLGRLASWGVLGATWAVLVGVLGRLEGSWGHMAGFWEPLSGTVWGRMLMGLGVGKRDGLRCFPAARPTLLNTVTHIVPRRPPEASKGDCLLCPLVPARISV